MLSPGRGQRMRAARRRDADRRLLQRQPDVDARRPRRPRRDRRAHPGRRAASPCSATCSSSAPTSAASTREIGEHAAQRDVDVLVTVGPLAAAMGDALRRRAATRSPTPARPPRSLPELLAARRRRARQGLARRRPRARLRRADSRRPRPDGLDLRPDPDRGDGVAADVPVPQPEVHRVPAAHEFGQNIREEGPEGHHAKAGTPTMGGIIIFIAIAVPFLILSDARLAVDRRVRRGARLRAARLRRRLHEDRQAPLARAAGADEAGRHDRDLARAVVGGDAEGRASRRASSCGSSTSASTSGRCTRSSSTSSSPARPAPST